MMANPTVVILGNDLQPDDNSKILNLYSLAKSIPSLWHTLLIYPQTITKELLSGFPDEL